MEMTAFKHKVNLYFENQVFIESPNLWIQIQMDIHILKNHVNKHSLLLCIPISFKLFFCNLTY